MKRASLWRGPVGSATATTLPSLRSRRANAADASEMLAPLRVLGVAAGAHDDDVAARQRREVEGDVARD